MNPLFDEIAHAGEVALGEAERLQAAKERDFGAVNWCDIGVVEVYRCEDRSGRVIWLVEIEEASPGCDLGAFVHGRLAEQFPGLDLDVRVAW